MPWIIVLNLVTDDVNIDESACCGKPLQILEHRVLVPRFGREPQESLLRIRLHL